MPRLVFHPENPTTPSAGTNGERVRTVSAAARAVALSAAMIAGLGASGLAHAGLGWGLSGTYAATSLGEWAKTNERYHDEATVRSTWTISTTCSSPVDCTGTVRSDQGWTANIYTSAGPWFVKRTLTGWEPCPDGTAADGVQIFRFYPVNPDGSGAADLTGTSPTLVGEDATTGPSGACGKNQWLEIKMPFKLEKLT